MEASECAGLGIVLLVIWTWMEMCYRNDVQDARQYLKDRREYAQLKRTRRHNNEPPPLPPRDRMTPTILQDRFARRYKRMNPEPSRRKLLGA